MSDQLYKCPECKWTGTKSQMESDHTGSIAESADEAWSNWICPKCHTWWQLDDYEIIDMKAHAAYLARLRVAYTVAPQRYDGFGTITLEADAGVDDRGQAVRKVGIEPEHWGWQTQRYWSGMQAVATEDEAQRFPSVWRLKTAATA